MLIFYAAAFGYTGQVEFVEKGCSCGGIEVEPERLPSMLMQFAEYYMAVRSLYENPDLNLVLLDRTLAGEAGHLVWSVGEPAK